MRGITTTPRVRNPLRLAEPPEPQASSDHVLVETLLVGVRHGPRNHRGRARSAPARARAYGAGSRGIDAMSSMPPAAVVSQEVTWSFPSCGGPTPFRVPTAPQASGTCAAMVATPCTEHRYRQEEAAPADRRCGERAERRPERHATCHRGEGTAKRPSALFELVRGSDERQREGHDCGGADAGH